MYTIDNIIQKTLSYLPSANTDLIKRCYLYAYEAHKDAKRKSGIDYIQHPLAVADLVTTLKLDVNSICAAILHDVREDAPDRTLDLEAKFGKDIAKIVEGVTKLKKYTFTSKQAQQAENFKRMIIAMSEDIRVILVKLCDRLNNMRELQFMPPEKQGEIAAETLHIYAPLADRLGISWISTELQDISFKYLMPEEYENLKKHADARLKERVKYIRNVIEIITTSLENAGFKGFEVTGRPKNLYGIYKKIKTQRIDLEQVYDFVAFRVIVQTWTECWNALGIIHGTWTPIMGRFKDWISVPKPNGYQSLHTVVIGPEREPMEVQIRTWEMHKVAESGIAAHWKYKEGNIVNIKDEQKFNWLKQLVEWVSELQNPSDFLDTLKSDLFSDEIYLFTPKGDLRVLPKGSTPVDFAYEIHTEIGNHCCGAKVNGHIASLNHPLKSGNIVEILTSKSQRPNKDWLHFVKTSKARNKIRAFFQAEEKLHGIEIGKSLLEKEFKKYGLNLRKYFKNSAEAAEITSKLKVASIEDMYREVASGKIKPFSVIELVAPQVAKEAEVHKQKAESKITDFFLRRKEGIQVDGVEDMMLKLGKCCSPIPGDEIVSYVTRGRGVTIHVKDCENIIGADPDRILNAYWVKGKEGDFYVPLNVVCLDEPGIIAKITKEIGDRNSNISSISSHPLGDHRADIRFILTVRNLDMLRDILRAIDRVKGVLAVERLRQR